MKQKLNFDPMFIDDCIWMSYRYSIGRHTIAAHSHAADIANCINNNPSMFSDDKKRFYSEDINSCIKDHLNIHDFLDIDNPYQIPKEKFQPLYILFDGMIATGIDTIEKLRLLKTIEVFYDCKTGEFIYNAIMHTHGQNYRSLWDITDLEIWQRLSSFLDKRQYKKCTLKDGAECEYYDAMVVDSYNDKITFKKYKVPVDKNTPFSTSVRFIPEDYIINQ